MPENINDASKLSVNLKESAPSNAKANHTKSLNPRHKRQKLEAETASTQKGQVVKLSRPDKYVRGRRGHLKLMTELSIDTLHEIFRLLDPLDLLYLSWANKSLRVIVMEKAARYIWAQAYERLYVSDHPPPRCPEDVNLAQYTRFLYHQKCVVCEIKIGYHASWEMRLRACHECLKHSKRFTVVRYDDQEIGRLLLRARKKTFVQARMPPCEEVHKRREGIRDFDAWQKRCLDDRRADQQRRRIERVDAIFKRLNEIGWSEEYIKKINNGELPGDLPGFCKVGKLTEKVWTEIQPSIVEILSQKKEIYLKQCLKKRWACLKMKLEEWYPTQALDLHMWPRSIDIAVLEPFRTAIFASETEEIEIKEDDIDRVAKGWVQWRDQRLFSLLPEELQIRYQAGKPSLEPLAIFRFTTLDIKNELLGEICRRRRHSTELPVTQPLLTPEQRKIQAAVIESGLCDFYPWEWSYPDLQFDTAGFEVAVEVLKFLEMDPYTTTVRRIPEYGRRLRCRDSDHTGFYTCWSMCHHVFQYHYDEMKRGTPLADVFTRAR